MDSRGLGESITQLLVFVSLFVAMLLAGYAEISAAEFAHHQQSLAERTAQGTTKRISQFIIDTQKSIALFVVANAKLIERLTRSPKDNEIYDRLMGRLDNTFRHVFSFTLANPQGELIVNRFKERIQSDCRDNIHNYIHEHHPQKLAIHPNPLGSHFDIMLAWINANHSRAVFFLSFLTDSLSHILAEGEFAGHRLLIENQNIPGLIEVSAQGSRGKLYRKAYLNQAETSQILATQPIAGTQWNIIVLPDSDLLARQRLKVWLQASSLFVGFIAMMIYMGYRIRRQEHWRSLAETALRDSHRQLENRVKQRTLELMATNEHLSREIAQREQTQSALEASKERYALALKGSNDAIWDWDLNAHRVHFSSRLSSLLGEAHSLSGSPERWWSHIHVDDVDELKAAINAIKAKVGAQLSLEFRMRHHDGSYLWILIRGTSVRDHFGNVNRLAGSLTDITQRKLVEEQLIHDAFHDALTGLPNRALFSDRLNHAIHKTQRHEEYQFAVLFLDLDRFKQVNDSFGHAAGDRLLVAVAQRINALIRTEDTLARLSGDEFVILQDGIGSVSDATLLAGRVIKQLEEPFNIENQDIYLGISVGVALSESKYSGADTLLRDADIAMYQAKTRDKSGYEVFDKRVRDKIVQRLNLETELRHALERNEFHVVYQPVIDLAAGKICGFEALARWQHPYRGLIEPSEFIPIAEDTALISALGNLVLLKACQQVQCWRQRGKGHALPLFMAVNISTKQFLRNGLVAQVEQVLQETELIPSELTLSLEITETTLMKNLPMSTDILQQLQALGLKLSVDDFGTGYSSLSYLQSLPIDTLKIDRSFVSRMHQETRSREIVKAVIGLSKSLNLKVVAEGIESNEQLKLLRDMGCAYGQGFYFSIPLNGDDAEQLMVNNPPW